MTMTHFYNSRLTILQSKNKRHSTKYVNWWTKKWKIGHGTIDALLNYIATPICQSEGSRETQTFRLSVYLTH